jgi:hypothetical protein
MNFLNLPFASGGELNVWYSGTTNKRYLILTKASCRLQLEREREKYDKKVGKQVGR